MEGMKNCGSINFSFPGSDIRWHVSLFPADQFENTAHVSLDGKFRIRIKELAPGQKAYSVKGKWYSNGEPFQFFTLPEIMVLLQSKLLAAVGCDEITDSVDERLTLKKTRVIYSGGSSNRFTYTMSNAFPIDGILHTHIMELNDPVPLSSLKIFNR